MDTPIADEERTFKSDDLKNAIADLIPEGETVKKIAVTEFNRYFNDILASLTLTNPSYPPIKKPPGQSVEYAQIHRDIFKVYYAVREQYLTIAGFLKVNRAGNYLAGLVDNIEVSQLIFKSIIIVSHATNESQIQLTIEQAAREVYTGLIKRKFHTLNVSSINSPALLDNELKQRIASILEED